MKASEISVNVGVSVDEEEAERARIVLNWFCRDNGMVLIPVRGSDGSVEMQFTYDTGVNGICPACGQTAGQQVIKGFANGTDA